MESIEYLGRQLPLLGHYDTVVVGGGAAGAAAGIRCAIDGQKVRFWAARLPVRWCAP